MKYKYFYVPIELIVKLKVNIVISNNLQKQGNPNKIINM